MNGDLISREALQYLFKKECVGECRICKHFTCIKDDSESMTHCRLMDDAPAVDAAPVVHCYACKYFETDAGFCRYWESGTRCDDFCSRGEKMDLEDAAECV